MNPLKLYTNKRPKYIQYLNVGRYVGAKSAEEIAEIAKTERAINATKAASATTAQRVAALQNQTGGNILGFTYE